MQDTLLSLQHISKNFGEGDVLRDISLDVARGEFVTLLGASGCGKTTTLRIISGLETPDEGSVILNGKDVTDLPPEKRPVNTVFQSYALFPHMNVAKNVGYGLRVHGMDKKTAAARVEEMLELVQMSEYANRMPAQLSGGQRQRIAIARALITRPRFVVADEPVSALDVSIQAQVLNLLMSLQDELGLSYLFISHDLNVVRHISNRVGVMYLGRIVETGDTEEVYTHPLHPYTQALLSAIPRRDPSEPKTRIHLQGDVPSPANPPSGCPFHNRCPQCMGICKETMPQAKDMGGGHLVSCHLFD